MSPQVQPLSYRHRFLFFYLLLAVFVAALPFLILYATGYKLGWGDSLKPTGGLYVAAERSGVQIFIDDQLVRETRIFRRAFYAQGLEAGTHKVHLQKAGHHTWTKELPVYAHLVTEAQAFNLPLVPNVRLITKWQTPAGVSVITATSTVLFNASTTSQYLLEPRANSASLVENPEFADLLELFVEPKPVKGKVATSTATTTKEWRGVQLSEDKEGKVFASFVGSREQMPYYYCAEPFPRFEVATSSKVSSVKLAATVVESQEGEEGALSLPLQTISDEQECDPVIQIGGGEAIQYFDFFPDSIDLIVIGTDSGAYVIEVDNRAWQNRQPLLLGTGLKVRVVNGTIYAYDGKVIYQVLINQNWF